MVPKRGDWVAFSYQKISTFVLPNGEDDVRLSNRYIVTGQVDKVGGDYILLAELSKTEKSNSKPIVINGRTFHRFFRCHKFVRIQGLHKVSSRGIDIISPPQIEESEDGQEV